MRDILAFLQPIQHSVSKTTLRQWSRIIVATPISQAISGVLSKWNLTMLFAIPGTLILLLTIWMASHPDLKGFSESLTAAQVEA